MNIGQVESGVIVQAYWVDEVPPHMAEWTHLPDYISVGWVWDGADWVAPAAIEPVPTSVSRFQARAAMYQMGMLDAVEALTQAAGGLILIAWQDAGEFRRNSDSIAGLAPHLGLTDADLDNLFRLAATITV